jgi:hypothetical protein
MHIKRIGNTIKQIDRASYRAWADQICPEDMEGSIFSSEYCWLI